MLEKCRICYDIEDKWMSKDEWEAGIEKKAGGGRGRVMERDYSCSLG